MCMCVRKRGGRGGREWGRECVREKERERESVYNVWDSNIL